MLATGQQHRRGGRVISHERLENELAKLSPHLNAATVGWLELVAAAEREGVFRAHDVAT